MGLTREIVSDGPGDDSSRRVSLATLSADAAFSRFDGCDRTFLLVAGGPVVLSSDNWRHRLDVGSEFAFAGEEPVHAKVASPALALNVITRRERVHHSVERLHTGGSIDAALTVILSANWSLDGRPLDLFDAIEGACTLAGGGEAVVVRFTPSD